MASQALRAPIIDENSVMKIRISMTIDETETIDLLTMERGELQAGNLGFSLAEAKLFLANGQKTLVDAQAVMHARDRPKLRARRRSVRLGATAGQPSEVRR